MHGCTHSSKAKSEKGLSDRASREVLNGLGNAHETAGVRLCRLQKACNPAKCGSGATGRGLHTVEHQVDHDTRDRDVEPNWKSQLRGHHVFREIVAEGMASVTITRGTTAIARIVCERRIVK